MRVQGDEVEAIDSLIAYHIRVVGKNCPFCVGPELSTCKLPHKKSFCCPLLQEALFGTSTATCWLAQCRCSIGWSSF
jgi:hypothetical protein